jgi:hypothetical protein
MIVISRKASCESGLIKKALVLESHTVACPAVRLMAQGPFSHSKNRLMGSPNPLEPQKKSRWIKTVTITRDVRGNGIKTRPARVLFCHPLCQRVRYRQRFLKTCIRQSACSWLWRCIVALHRFVCFPSASAILPSLQDGCLGACCS